MSDLERQRLDRLAERISERTGQEFFIGWDYDRPRLHRSVGESSRVDVSPRLDPRDMERWLWAFLEGMDAQAEYGETE